MYILNKYPKIDLQYIHFHSQQRLHGSVITMSTRNWVHPWKTMESPFRIQITETDGRIFPLHWLRKKTA